jgi:hypothetical protein
MMLLLLAVAAITSMSGGCAYMKDRGNDALDMFDIGITVSKEPHFAVYGGFQSLLALGYADVDGKLIGLGQRQFGVLDMRYNAAGSLLEGYEQFAYGDKYDPSDPASPPKRGAGLGLLYYETPKSFTEALQCAKFVHLFWIGVDVDCKIGEVFDFLLGWTTLDIGNDDVHGKSPPEA